MPVSLVSTPAAAGQTEWMRFEPHDLPERATELLTARRLATLTSRRRDGTPHVVPVGFTWDGETSTARVITSDGSQKVRNIERDGYVALGQIDGAEWLTLEGVARISRDPTEIDDAVARYARRYRTPRVNPRRVAIVIDVRRVMGHLRAQ